MRESSFEVEPVAPSGSKQLATRGRSEPPNTKVRAFWSFVRPDVTRRSLPERFAWD